MIPIKQNETLDGYSPHRKAKDVKQQMLCATDSKQRQKRVLRESMILWMSGFYLELLQTIANVTPEIMDSCGVADELMANYDKFVKVNRKKTKSKVRNDKRLRSSIFLSVLRCSLAKKSSPLTRLPNTYRMGAVSYRKVKMEPSEIENKKLFFYDPQIEEINSNMTRVETVLARIDEVLLTQHAKMSKLRDIVFKTLGYLLERPHPKFTPSSVDGNTIIEYVNMSSEFSVQLWAFLMSAVRRLENIIPERAKRIRKLHDFVNKYTMLLDKKVKIHILLESVLTLMTNESCLVESDSSKLPENVVEKWRLWINEYWEYLLTHYKKHNEFPKMRVKRREPVVKQSIINTSNDKHTNDMANDDAYVESLRVERVRPPPQMKPIPKSEREIKVINISSKRKKGKRRGKNVKAVIHKLER